jgi:hypothetical protein
MVIWYIFTVLVCSNKKNQATTDYAQLQQQTTFSDSPDRGGMYINRKQCCCKGSITKALTVNFQTKVEECATPSKISRNIKWLLYGRKKRKHNNNDKQGLGFCLFELL